MPNLEDMETLVSLSKTRGFIFPGSDIYGGLANSWDYGPLGVQLKQAVKNAWWKRFVQEREENVGLDAAILMNPKVWEASGHVSNFDDPLIDCRACHTRYRADQMIEDDFTARRDKGETLPEESLDGKSDAELEAFVHDHDIHCPSCGEHDWTSVRRFNMMFKTFQGVTQESGTEIYLRPETAQGIFVNFLNVQRSMRKKIPFGVCQIGKAFRNEITPGNFTFRTREFEQMEMQFFCKPGTSLDWFEFWRGFAMRFLEDLGLPADDLRFRDHSEDELSFYSKATTDIEYLFPFGWGELWGIADRQDYDLGQHQEHSKRDMTYFDPELEEKYIPHVVEPSLGVDRLTLALLCAAYEEEMMEDGKTRTVMHFHPAIAPIKIAILPLSNKLSDEAMKVFELLSKHHFCELDTRQSIGRRYRRQDEIGTPYCVTFDFDSLDDQAVTIRERDSMEQVRIPIAELVDYFADKFYF